MPLGAGRAAMMGAGIEPDYIFTDTISVPEAAYNLRTEALADGWNGTQPLLATLTVSAIATSTTTDPAFKTDSIPHISSTLTITMNSGAGFRGQGGDGGAGGDFSGPAGSNGSVGGLGMDFQMDATIVDNAGEISGGGGGGGGGQGVTNGSSFGGGGGGGGFPNGVGAAGGTGDPGDGGTGADGTTGGGGTGGSAGGAGAETGGTGGDVAAAGQSKTGTTGGAAGAAIEKNGNTVTLSIGSATINGDINA